METGVWSQYDERKTTVLYGHSIVLFVVLQTYHSVTLLLHQARLILLHGISGFIKFPLLHIPNKELYISE